MRKLFDRLIKMKIIDRKEAGNLLECIKIRNKAVHKVANIKKNSAEFVLKTITDFSNNFRYNTHRNYYWLFDLGSYEG